MISRTARTLTAVSALVLGFGPAMVRADDANNTPYAKYLDCSSSQGKTTAGGSAKCVERGEVLKFSQLRDIIAAAMYRYEGERRYSLRPDSDSRDGTDNTYADGSTTRPPERNGLTPYGSTTDGSTRIRLQDGSGSGNPSGSIAETSTPGSATPIMPARRSERPVEETADGSVVFPPALIPPALPVVVRYERGVNDQSMPSSRLVFTVRDETGESSSYSVNLSDEAGQYIEREIIRNQTASPAMASQVAIAEEPAAPLDMEEVVVSQEMIPIASNSEVVASREAQVPVEVSPSSQPAEMQVSSQTTTTVVAQMQSAPPAPAQPTVSYLPPQITIMESSVESQPIMVSYYTFNVEQQPVTATSYTFTVQGNATPISAEPVITVTLRPAQPSNDTTVTATTLRPAQAVPDSTVTMTTMTTTTTVASADAIMLQPYVIMISPTETVQIVPQQVETSINVVAAIGQGTATPGENVRDQVDTEGRNTASLEDIGNAAPPPSHDDDDSPRSR